MKTLTLFTLKHKINNNGPLKSCLILMAVVTIPVIIALVFSQSMISGITDIYICLSDGHIQTSEQPVSSDIIYSCNKTLTGYVMIYSKNQVSGLKLKGVDDSYFNQRRSELIEFENLSDEASSNLKKIYISESTAKKLAVGSGDKVALMLVSSNGGTSARPVLAVVGGTFKTGYNQLDSTLAFTDLDTAVKWFDGTEVVNEILLTKDFGTDSNKAASVLGLKSWSGWESQNRLVYNNLQTSSKMIMLILILVAVMAAFYTAMVSNQLVSEDLRNMAVKRLLGMNKNTIMVESIASIMFVTVVGMVTGLLIGLALSFLLNPMLSFISNAGTAALSNYLLNFKIIVPWKSILLVFIVMLLLALISVVLSLLKTRRITPMQLFTEV